MLSLQQAKVTSQVQDYMPAIHSSERAFCASHKYSSTHPRVLANFTHVIICITPYRDFN